MPNENYMPPPHSNQYNQNMQNNQMYPQGNQQDYPGLNNQTHVQQENIPGYQLSES